MESYDHEPLSTSKVKLLPRPEGRMHAPSIPYNHAVQLRTPVRGVENINIFVILRLIFSSKIGTGNVCVENGGSMF